MVIAKEPSRNVYVGHRYVPLILGQWLQTETYEGLSIVTNQGDSYTSKKRVPIGIDIANEEYWVLTGNYNAQIDQYRQDVTNFKTETTKQLNDIGYNVTMFNAIGDNATDNKSAIQAMLNAGYKNIILPKGTFLINNLLTGLTVTGEGVTISGKGKLKAMYEANDLIKVTAPNFTIEDISIEGNGVIIETNEAEEKVALLKIDGRNVNQRMNYTVRNVKFINPPTVSLQSYQAVGGTIEKNDFVSNKNASNLTTSFSMHVLLSGSAYIDIVRNSFDGMAQGIGGSGFGTATVFSDFSGVTSNINRHIKVDTNTFKNHYDHAMYFSDYNEYLDIIGNTCKSRNDAIKVEGRYINILNNPFVAEGITGRNVSDITIDNNNIVVTKTGSTIYAIFLGSAVFKRLTENVNITNNKMKHLGGESLTAIWVLGEYWDNFQNRLKNITIEGNDSIGFGDMLNGCSILIEQQLPVVAGVVQNFPAQNVKLLNNTTETGNATAQVNNGYKLSGGIDDVTLEGNTIKGATSNGVFLLGVSNLTTGGNNITMSAAGAFTKTGIMERANDTTLHLNNRDNTYGLDKIIGASNEVIWANESTKRSHKYTARLVGNSSQTNRPYHNVNRIFKSVVATGYSYTLGNIETSPYSLGDVIEIYNFGTVPFTVEPNALVLNGGEMVVAYHLGLGAFTYFKK